MLTLVLLVHGGLLLGLASSWPTGPRAAPPAPAWRTAVRTIEAPRSAPALEPAPAPAPAAAGLTPTAPPTAPPATQPAAAPATQPSTAPATVSPTPPRAVPAAPAAPAPAEAAAPAIAALAAPAPANPPPAPAADTPAAEPPPVPTYRAPLPPAFEATFSLRRGALAGRALWRFDTSADGGYALSLQSSALGRDLGHLRSQGQRADDGLRPQRFVEGRGGRDRRAVNFERDAAGGGRIRFSGPDTELPLPPGVQDRLSWLLQLAAIVDAEPRLRERGAEVAMWVVSPRGDADVWIFVVTGADAGTLQLRRASRRPWDTEVAVWLDPAERHLPLRARWRQAGPDGGGEGAVELRRETLAWR